jgi:hypothetical protein
VQPLGSDGRIVGVGADARRGIDAGRNEDDRAQCSRIIENDSGPIVEMNRRAGVSGTLRVGTGDPIARHAKMGVKHSAIFEVDELVLAASAHAGNQRAHDRPTLGRRDTAAQGGMMDVERSDALADDERSKRYDCALDFREFWQIESGPNERLD